jgi:3-hydroxyisobutyrate dehydrogenase-like beta-hydroxyacid dehydrogenase
MGPSGSGQLTKMVNQICITGLVQGLAEGINFSQKAGLDVSSVIEVISKGAAQSWQMENRWETMTQDQYDHGFAVDHMRKDLKIAIEEAHKQGAIVEITELIDGYYKDIQDMGGNRWDTSSLLKRLQDND